MAPVVFVKQVFKSFGTDKVGQLSAAFAYGALFSIGPLLLVLISVIGFIFGQQASEGKLYTELASTVGPSAAKTIQDVVVHTHKSSSGLLALVVGIIGMLLGASGITSQLQNSFNAILQVVPDPKGGIKRTLYVKAKNIFVVIFGGIFIAASLIFSAIIVGLGNSIQKKFGIPPLTLELLNNAISFGVFIALLYIIFRVIPDVVIPRKVVVAASAAVAALFLVGKIVLAIVIGGNGTASAYGAAAALVTLLLWIYYSGQILFLGAEGIKVYGFNHSLTYEAKKFNLKRTTLTIDSTGTGGSLFEAWHRGFKKGIARK